MHWIIQDGFFHERGMEEMKTLLEKYDIPHTVVKVVPFSGEIIPNIIPEGNVICFGSYSMRHTAKKNGWYPGVFDLEGISDQLFNSVNIWTKHLLNEDWVLCSFEDAGIVAANLGLTEFFMRPVADSKVFAGNVFSTLEYDGWRYGVVELEEDDGTSLRKNTPCIVSKPKVIYSEYRLFVIGDVIVTASQYKINGRVKYKSLVDGDIIQFGKELIAEWPEFAAAYCLDLCRTNDGIKIVEVNTINSAGFYDANVTKLIEAFTDIYWREEQ